LSRHPESRHLSATLPIVSYTADCDVIVCYGAAKLTDKHLTATVHCVDDEIFEFLQRREQRRPKRRDGFLLSCRNYLLIRPHSLRGGESVDNPDYDESR
jgi:hypothetical protein